ncbi:caspase family protein [Actinomadura sp. WMMB 499]|uniref:caspase family protein n=1 Tax=Actinomadura sp. WMMB 499 TaxID=1219491 RepID=UPI0020C75FAA
MPEEISLVRGALVEACGMDAYDGIGLDPTADELKDAVRAATAADPQADIPAADFLVLYYSGHGFLRFDTEFCLAVKNGSRSDESTFISAHALLAAVYDTDVRAAAVILDACVSAEAGGAYGGLLQQIEGRRAFAPTVYLFTSTSRIEDAEQLVFAEAFAAALREPGIPRGKRFIPPSVLRDEIDVRMSRSGQTPTLDFPQVSKVCEIFPNPLNMWRKYDRPSETVSGTGWRFCGRRQAVSEMVAHLSAERPPDRQYLVTGASGSGKSTLLRWVVAAAEGAPLPSGEGDLARLVPLACVDLFLDARDQYAHDVLKQIGDKFGVRSEVGTDDFFRELEGVAGSKRILVDSVHRATEPAELIEDALIPLARLSTTRLVMACDSVPRGLSAHEIDLEGPDYFDAVDVRELVWGVLADRTDSRHRNARHAVLEDICDRVAEQAGTSFLRAYLFALDMAARDSHDVEAEMRASVTEIFREQLARLAPDDPTWAADLLVPLAYAFGAGMPNRRVWLGVVRRLTGRDADHEDLLRLFDKADEFMTESPRGEEDAGWRIQSEELAQYLAELHESGRVHAAFTEALLDALPVGMDRTPSWGRADRYTRVNFAEHAFWAGVLDEYLDDPGFLLAMDSRRLRRAFTLWGTESARAVREVCDRMRGSGVDDGCTVSRLSFLAAAFGRDRLAGRAASMTDRWKGSWIERAPAESVAVVNHGGGHLVVALREGGALVCTLRTGRWWRLSLDDRDLVTALDAGVLDGRPFAVVGQLSGRVTLHELNEEDDPSELCRFDSQVVSCVLRQGELYVSALQEWTFFEVGVGAGPKVDVFGHFLADLSATTVAGRRLVAGITANEVILWDASGEEIDRFRTSQSRALTSVTVLGTEIVTASDDGSVQVTELRDGRTWPLFSLGDQPITSLRCCNTSDGHRLLATGQNGSLIICGVGERSAANPIKVDVGFPVQSADLEETGRLVVATEKGIVRLFL